MCFTAPPPLPQLAVNNCNQRPSEATETSLTNPHTHTHHDRPLCTVLRVQNSVQTTELYYKLGSIKRSQSPFPKTAKAQPWFGWLVAGLSPRRSGLDTGPVHVRIVMDSGIETGFSPTTAGFPCQNHSTNAPHSSPTHCSYQKDKRANLGSLPKSNVPLAIVELWITKFHLVFKGLRLFLK